MTVIRQFYDTDKMRFLINTMVHETGLNPVEVTKNQFLRKNAKFLERFFVALFS